MNKILGYVLLGGLGGIAGAGFVYYFWPSVPELILTCVTMLFALATFLFAKNWNPDAGSTNAEIKMLLTHVIAGFSGAFGYYLFVDKF